MNSLDLTTHDLETFLIGLSLYECSWLHGVEVMRVDERYVTSEGTARYRHRYLIGKSSEPLLLLPAVDALAEALRGDLHATKP